MKRLVGSFVALMTVAFGFASAQTFIDVPLGGDLATAVATASAQATDKDGVTLRLAKGDYMVSSLITLDKNVSIVGKGREFTRLVSDGKAHGLVKIVHASSVVSDLALVGAKPVNQHESAVWVAGGTLQDALVTGSGASGYDGGGVSLSAGTVSRVIATGNTAQYGGGFFVVTGGTGTMENCLAYGNTASYGGGIYTDGNSTPTIVNCTFEGNTATYGLSGGHDYYDYCKGTGKATVVNCALGQRIVNNQASRSTYTTCVNSLQSPTYVSSGANNYRPAEGSILIGAGTTVDYTQDVDGNAYPTGVPSIGAYQVGGVDATRGNVTVSTALGFKGAPITLTVNYPTEGTFASAELTVVGPDATEIFAVTDGQAVSFTPPALGNYSVVLEMTDGDGNATVAYRAHNCFTAGVGDVYVDATSVSPEAPYDSPEKAAKTIEVAVASVLDGGTVWIIGDYKLRTALTVTRPVTIRGSGAAKSVITASATSWAMFTLTQASATLQNLVIDGEGNTVAQLSGRGVTANGGGCLVDCEIRGFTLSGNVSGAAVIASAGTLRIDRCVFHDNTTPKYGAAVYVAAKGRVDCRNSLFYANTGTWGSAFYNDGPGSLVNCTFFDNPLATVSNGEFCRDYADFGVTNCVFGTVSWYSGGTTLRSNNVESSADPGFVDRANHDYRPSASAATLHDCGLDDVVAEDETDLAGAERIQGAHVDIGCYEFSENVFSAGFTIEGGVTNVGDKVRLVPTIVGGKNPVNSWRVINLANESVISKKTSGTGDAGAVDVTFTEPGVYTFEYSVVDGENTASAVYAKARTVYSTGDIFVEKNGAGEAPFDTPERATTNLVAALMMAGDGTTVHIGAGTFYLDARVAIDRAVTVEGISPEATVITCESDAAHGLLEVSHADAVVRQVTLTGTFSSLYAEDVGGAIRLLAGVFEDSVVTGVVMRANVDGPAIGMKANYPGARVSRVRVANCHGGRWGTVYLYAFSYVDNILVTDSTVDGRAGMSPVPYGGLLYIDTGASYVTNCTFVGTQTNAFYNNGGLASPRVVNCLFACPVSTSVAGDLLTTNVFHNCVATCPIPESQEGLGNVQVENVRFVNAANGDYHLKSSSPACRTGKCDPWMRNAQDLDRRKRAAHGKVDVGCYQCSVDGFSILIK